MGTNRMDTVITTDTTLTTIIVRSSSELITTLGIIPITIPLRLVATFLWYACS